MLLIIVGALMLVGLVIVHELGHFYFARKAGVVVEEFGIGFPPRAKVLGKKNGTVYTLNWLPLGGFVRLKGEHDADKSPGSFGAARLRDKVKIMLAGVAVNLFVALFLMTIVAAVALPQVLGDKQFWVASDTHLVRHDVVAAYIVPESPAEQAGLEAGDKLLSLTDKDCNNQNGCTLNLEKAENLRGVTSTLAGKTVSIMYAKATDDRVVTSEVVFNTEAQIEESRVKHEECVNSTEIDENDDSGVCPATQSYFGVIPDDYIEQRATWSAPIVAVGFSAQIIQESFAQFGHVIGGLSHGDTAPAEDNLVGVVGIGYTLGKIAERGFIAIIFLTAIISLSLALMNFLPIPALDGGRLFVTLVFRALKKPLTQSVEERIHGSGFAFLMLLFVFVTILDVRRIIS